MSHTEETPKHSNPRDINQLKKRWRILPVEIYILFKCQHSHVSSSVTFSEDELCLKQITCIQNKTMTLLNTGVKETTPEKPVNIQEYNYCKLYVLFDLCPPFYSQKLLAHLLCMYLFILHNIYRKLYDKVPSLPGLLILYNWLNG